MNVNAFLLSKSDAFLQCFVTLVPARWCPKLGAILYIVLPRLKSAF